MPSPKDLYARLRRFYSKNPNTLLRRISQAGTVLIFLVAAWQFARFAAAIKNPSVAEAYRPPVVEGFLPVAAITALRGWLATGVFDALHPAGLVILIATLATAFLFRRALCSWLCPLGTLSEVLGKTGKNILGRNFLLPKWLDRSLLALKYLLLAWLFDLFFLMPPQQAVSFMRLPYYAVSDAKMFDFFTRLGVGAATFIAILATASLFVRSFWCRYLCPYGALLGALGLFSPVFLKRDGALCNGCGACSTVCPMSVDVAGKKKSVLSPECTACTSCAGVCPKKGALSFRLLGRVPIKPVVFGLAFLAFFYGAVFLAKVSGRWESSLGLPQYRAFYDLMGGG